MNTDFHQALEAWRKIRSFIIFFLGTFPLQRQSANTSHCRKETVLLHHLRIVNSIPLENRLAQRSYKQTSK